MVQTPQVFRKELLLDAYRAIKKNAGVTDDSMLVELNGLKPKLVQGDYTNIKITAIEPMRMTN